MKLSKPYQIVTDLNKFQMCSLSMATKLYKICNFRTALFCMLLTARFSITRLESKKPSMTSSRGNRQLEFSGDTSKIFLCMNIFSAQICNLCHDVKCFCLNLSMFPYLIFIESIIVQFTV